VVLEVAVAVPGLGGGWEAAAVFSGGQVRSVLHFDSAVFV
jgi:hypothetical protein